MQILQSHQRFVKKWKLFLIKCPEKLRRETFFILSTRKLYVISEMYTSLSQKKQQKKTKKRET